MQETYSFGYWVLRRRKALNWTREKLARRVGCATETIKKIERDERRPSREIAELLAQALGVPSGERTLFLQVARGERSVERLHLDSQPLLSSSEQTQHNLPTQLTPFIGRENELAKIEQLLADPDCRLLTLVGPGGVGKSRAAIRTAENQIGRYRHGIYLIPLASIESADAIPSAIMTILGLKLRGHVRPELLNYLREMDREMLLVLDNFEHLLQATDLLIEILQNTEQLKILVTSRERLNVQCEWVVPLAGLPYPSMPAAGRIEEYAAVRLFLHTAQRVRADFALHEAEQPFVSSICQLVEGLPLAIELAASWTRALSCQDIACELERGIGILATSGRDVLERHRNMRSVFEQSWKLLSEDERCVLQQLSVFRGGFTREAAEQVVGASLPILSSLVDKSLIHLDEHLGETQRYSLHQLIRQYAYERLFKKGEVEVKQTRERHLETFLNLAERAEPELLGPHNLIWIERLDQDYDNIRVAFAWAVEPMRGGNGEQSQRLLGALWWFWCLRGHVEEACQWAERALSQDSSNEPVRARALWVWGYLLFFHGNPDRGRELLEQGAALCRKVGFSSKRDLALALNFLGVEAADNRGDFDAAQAYHEESLALQREFGDSWGISQALMNLGFVASKRGDFAGSQSLTEEGLSVARIHGEQSKVAMLLGNLGWVVLMQGDVPRAQSLFHESLEICFELRWQWLAATVFENLGVIEAWQAESKHLVKAARLWGVAERLHKVWGSLYRLEESEREIATAREQLGEASFSTAWAEGQNMTFDQAVAYAIEDE